MKPVVRVIVLRAAILAGVAKSYFGLGVEHIALGAMGAFWVFERTLGFWT